MTNVMYQDLTVKNTIDATSVGTNLLTAIRDKLFPVGSVVTTITSTSPAGTLGGTWERIEDKFLLAGGSTYAPGSTGGNQEHAHAFKIAFPSFFATPSWDAVDTSNGKMYGAYRYSTGQYGGLDSEAYIDVLRNPALSNPAVEQNDVVLASSTGDTQTQSNLPPYLAVYAWQRVA